MIDLYFLINKIIKIKHIFKMGLLFKNIIDAFFNNQNIIIEGQGPKTFNKEGIAVCLKKDPLKYFVLLTSNKHNIDWILHFENDSETEFAEEEKYILFDAISDIIQSGDIVTTEGGVTPGGISALKRLVFHGFKIIGNNSGQHVYWASPRMLNQEKFNKWIHNANKEDYKVINKENDLTIENTRPVVKILEKL